MKSDCHKPLALGTRAAHAGGTGPSHGEVVPPLHTSTTFARDANYTPTDGSRTYARDHAPTCLPAEQLIAGFEGGHEALLFGSGMAAITAFADTLRPGDAIAVQQRLYHGTVDLYRGSIAARGVDVCWFDGTNPDSLRAAMRPNTRAVWIETPANPTFVLTDIAACAEIAHRHGALLAVDSTCASPVLTRPFEHGADVVMHSATKYLNGHSDVLAGVLVAREDGERWQAIRHQRHIGGAVAGPFEAWLLLRGMRTLDLRVRAASANALALAAHLEAHPRVAWVSYPGLPSHPQHALAKRQMGDGFGGMLAFGVAGGAEAALAVVRALEVIVPATSLGGVESLIEHRATIEKGITEVAPELLRLSVGIEALADLVADLDAALGTV